jgi:leader peptidase (prepilin peptidase)/N-methyltransferase
VALALAVGALGALVVGPALNHAIARWVGWRVVVPVLLGRVPDADELGHPRPHCPDCGHGLSPAGLPALPWLASRGACPSCGAGRPRWCLVVELATGLLFGLAAARTGWSLTLLPLLALFAGLVAMSAVDLWCLRIPTRFAYATGAAVLVALGVATLGDADAEALGGAAIGAGAFGGSLLVLFVISPRMLGFGDVRLATVSGLVLGWLAWTPEHPVLDPVAAVVDAGLVAGLAGSVGGIALLVLRRRSAPFAFGPALALGAVVIALALA